MASQPIEAVGAESRFRQAFDRLKSGRTAVLESNVPITQNNVAREAGCDPTALKKSRFPGLIAEIQAYRETYPYANEHGAQRTKRPRPRNRSDQERLDHATAQCKQIQFALDDANNQIVGLTKQMRGLQRELDKLRPPSTQFNFKNIK